MGVLVSGHLGEKIKNIPTCFKSMYPDCRGIIDASDIKVQAPSSLVLNSEMYSSYKSHTTYKGNVVISPSGEIIHIRSLFEVTLRGQYQIKSWSGNLVFCHCSSLGIRLWLIKAL